MHLSELQGARIAVWGYGVEGRAVCDWLQAQLPGQPFTVLCPASEGARDGVQFDHGAVTAERLDAFDVVIKSPGISPYQAAVRNTRARITSSAALWFANHRHGRVIAVTGTKGKSTTASMLAAALESLGHRVVLAGNIGNPLLSCRDAAHSHVVLETSSYQAWDGAIQADVAVLLNVFPEHLDWHGSYRRYRKDKFKLLHAADCAVVQHGLQKVFSAHPRLVTFGARPNWHVREHALRHQGRVLLRADEWSLPGDHNLRNAAAVLAALAQVTPEWANAVAALRRFKPLPHRLQTVAQRDGVRYVSDSIASTPHATLAALESFRGQAVILLLGGHDRGLDWRAFARQLPSHAVRAVVCSGQNGEKIHNALKNQAAGFTLCLDGSLKQAVRRAQGLARPGDVVLLSPGAPSFDAFANYTERGEQFTRWITETS